MSGLRDTHGEETADDRAPVIEPSRRLRRGLVALGIAVVLPAAFTTTLAAASNWSQPARGCAASGTLGEDNGVVDGGDGCGCTPCWPRPLSCSDL